MRNFNPMMLLKQKRHQEAQPGQEEMDGSDLIMIPWKRVRASEAEIENAKAFEIIARECGVNLLKSHNVSFTSRYHEEGPANERTVAFKVHVIRLCKDSQGRYVKKLILRGGLGIEMGVGWWWMWRGT
mmetsp:Transcript_17931/g.45474  ORF Transcript_17931/g.45474 Transcript_17931/m.45474 type:complete len:128 (+) Transcript_17931:402-785(+)